jgi:hypothetical protein
MSKQIELLEVVRQAKDAIQENIGLHNDAQETISSLRELCFALNDRANLQSRKVELLEKRIAILEEILNNGRY